MTQQNPTLKLVTNQFEMNATPSKQRSDWGAENAGVENAWVESAGVIMRIEIRQKKYHKITHSHGSARVLILKATKQVNGKGKNSTPRHTKTP